jgi:glycylpeptide N-tetradecanoyltransferase
MSEESKPNDPSIAKAAADEVLAESKAAQFESENEDEQDEAPPAGDTPAASGAAAKKKKSKKKRIKAALTGKSSESSGSGSRDEISKAVSGLSKAQIEDFLKMNPALAQELGAERDVGEAMKRLRLEDIMTGLSANGKNVKDMASYKFWQTQPVPKFGDNEWIEEGPFKIIDVDQVPKEPGPLVDGFEWVTMDLTDDGEIKEVYELLNGHYVEDNEAMFRFNYSKAFFKW